MATSDLGDVIVCNLVRREDDTDDLTVRLNKGLADTTGFTAVLSISDAADGTPIASFNGVAATSPAQPNGLIIIDMDGFAVPAQTTPYKYDIRITDTNAVDNPSRVYFAGTFKVKDRIKA